MENLAELLENTEMNEHAIKLEKGKQPLFDPIYSLGSVELETLKIYIKPTWPTASSVLPNPLPEHLFFLIRSQIEASVFV